MPVVELWTGRLAGALRTALRLTNEGFAEELGTAVRTVAKWNAEPDLVPVTELQRALDTMLSRASDDAKSRFELLTAAPQSAVPAPTGSLDAGELRLAHDPEVSQLLSWLDERAGWPNGDARRRVAQLVESVDIRQLRDRAQRRSQVSRAEIAAALTAFYPPDDAHVVYRATCDGASVQTSILTKADWLDLQIPLGSGHDRLRLNPNESTDAGKLDDASASAAADRLAEVLATNTRVTNAPLYRLLNLHITPGVMRGEVGLTDFATYALTVHLLENELLDAIATGGLEGAERLSLRQRHLPDLPSIVDVASRVCAGGPLALFAAARPGTDDYTVLIQERSGSTLNASHRLAVIPKAFHQPLVDFSDDAQLSATIERELEEELLGRDELDTADGRRLADPMHLSRLSAPLRWLLDHDDPAAWQLECTGFGLNLVSGNYEFACLIVIHDPDWWTQFGGDVAANWEASGLRRYSTRDRRTLAQLVQRPGWSNEGLFAFLQGIRRLADIDDHRVDLPAVTLEM
jgi:hypothetical protein